MSKPCNCSVKDGVRVDKDGLPLWVKMEGCPSCDWQLYTPEVGPKLTPQQMRKY